MSRFSHSFKEAGKRGCWTSAEKKDCTTEHSILLGHLCHIAKGLSVGSLPRSADSDCGYVWACGHSVWCVGRGGQSSRVQRDGGRRKQRDRLEVRETDTTPPILNPLLLRPSPHPALNANVNLSLRPREKGQENYRDTDPEP